MQSSVKNWKLLLMRCLRGRNEKGWNTFHAEDSQLWIIPPSIWVKTYIRGFGM